jgi:hypothetical protein
MSFAARATRLIKKIGNKNFPPNPTFPVLGIFLCAKLSQLRDNFARIILFAEFKTRISLYFQGFGVGTRKAKNNL